LSYSLLCYRAFSQDKAVLLEEVSDPNAIVPLEPVELHVKSHPEATDTSPGGMHLLKRLPRKAIQPSPFIAGSHAYLQKVMAAVKSEYSVTNPQWVTAWRVWMGTAPSSDNVQDYVESHPEKYHIPFRDILFGDLDVDSDNVVPPVSRQARGLNPSAKKYKQMETSACVQWSGNGGASHSVEPFRPLGEPDVTTTRSRNKKPRNDAVHVKRKKRATGRSCLVEEAVDSAALLDDDCDVDATACHAKKKPIAKPTKRRRVGGTKKRAYSSEEDSAGSQSSSDGDDEEVGDMTSRPSSRRAASSAATAQMRRLAEEDADEPYESDTEEDVELRPVRNGHARSLRIVDSDEEDGEADEEGYREQEEEQEEVGNSDGEATDSDELDDAVYLSPDELGFQAVKPGIKKRVNGTWRDATYIRIYGCASYYLKWQFKHVSSRVDYRIEYVVRNVHGDSDDMYYKCARISGSSSSDSSYEYFKCVDLMTTQKKYRQFEWMKSSRPKKRNDSQRVKQVYPGWAILDDDDPI
jgi:hypothetical protein